MDQLEAEVKRWSAQNGYEINVFKRVSCPSCKQDTLLFGSDDENGAAVVECATCETVFYLENSEPYMETPSQNICTCDGEVFKIGVGKAFHEGTTDPRWIYIGAECVACGLGGVYVDWQER